MATVDPQRDAPGATTTPPAQPPATPPPEPKRRHSRWLWVSLALVVVSIGLLVWGLGKSSDLGDAQDQLDQQASNGSAVVSAAKGVYDDLTKELGATNEQLDAAEQDVADANAKAQQSQQQADAAEQQADAAKQQADKANDQTEKAQAQAKEAQANADAARADADAAQSKAQVVTDCAKAYISAIGTLFEGEDVKAQATAVREQLKGITAECKAAFAGS
jgi:chromosome segregation ATPase